MSNIFFTSDLHLNHNKDFIYTARGLNSVEEMNEAIVSRWNEVVRPEDTVFNLGDFVMHEVIDGISYVKRLNGKIIWIVGNHDSPKKVKTLLTSFENIECAGLATLFKHHKFNFYCSHYPTLTGNYDDREKPWQLIWNLHGHNHSAEKWSISEAPLCYNVGVDAHNCYPVNIEEITSDLKMRFSFLSKD